MDGLYRRLNMELDLQSLFGLLVHCCTHWLRPRNRPPPPSPAFGLIYEGAIDQQDRRHLSACDPWFVLCRKKENMES